MNRFVRVFLKLVAGSFIFLAGFWVEHNKAGLFEILGIFSEEFNTIDWGWFLVHWKMLALVFIWFGISLWVLLDPKNRQGIISVCVASILLFSLIYGGYHFYWGSEISGYDYQVIVADSASYGKNACAALQEAIEDGAISQDEFRKIKENARMDQFEKILDKK